MDTSDLHIFALETFPLEKLHKKTPRKVIHLYSEFYDFFEMTDHIVLIFLCVVKIFTLILNEFLGQIKKE